MPTVCAVPRCSNRTGHAFPWSNPARMKAWKVAIKRDKWEPTRHSVVCKKHFADDDYETRTTYGTQSLYKRLKSTAVPHIFPWSKAPTAAVRARRQRAKHKQTREMAAEVQRQNAVEEIGSEVTVPIDSSGVVPREMVEESGSTTTHDVSTQTDVLPLFSASRFENDPPGMHFYTGLGNYEKFIFILHSLYPAAEMLNYYHGVKPSISVEDQFFLTLIKLRQATTNFELSRMFSISENSVTNIFVTWVNFLAFEWQEQNWWPEKDLVKFFSPTDFRNKFPSTRVIIDGTECPVMKPKEPIAQQATFSHYKNRNTVKVLAGMSPGGLVTYVSGAYAGSTSDRQICERSELTSLCDPGDSIMADKGFNVQDFFEPSMVSINMPSFFRKKNRLSGETVQRDRKIASKRVHIERLIGLAKTYKILKKPLNNTESVLASQIIKVCFTLCNFRAKIVSNVA